MIGATPGSMTPGGMTPRPGKTAPVQTPLRTPVRDKLSIEIS